MAHELAGLGVPSQDIRIERHSIDTVTNLALSESEGHFGDPRPVAIVAQRAHLHRIMYYIAPRVLQRRFVGVVVPESTEEHESLWPTVASRLVLLGISADPEEVATTSLRRAARLWRIARALGGGRSYHTALSQDDGRKPTADRPQG